MPQSLSVYKSLIDKSVSVSQSFRVSAPKLLMSQNLKILDLIVSEVPEIKIDFCPSVLNLTFETKVSENTSNTKHRRSDHHADFQYQEWQKLNSTFSVNYTTAFFLYDVGHVMEYDTVIEDTHKKYHLSIDKVVRDSHYVYPFTVSRYLCTMLYLRKKSEKKP